MRVACIGLLPYPTRFWASALIAKPYVLMGLRALLLNTLKRGTSHWNSYRSNHGITRPHTR